MTTKKATRTRRGIRRRSRRPQVARGYRLRSGPGRSELGPHAGEGPGGDRLAQPGHQGEGPGQVVDREQAGGAWLSHQVEVAEVGARPASAHRAGAGRIERAVVLAIDRVAQGGTTG